MMQNCQVCGKSFRTYPSKIALGRGKFCSKICSMSVTNLKLKEGGKSNRFVKGHVTWNRKERVITKSRSKGTAYWLIYKPDHPNATKKGYVREHRWILEQEIGRLLTKDEEVHHLNYDGLDNRLENLILVSSSEHKRIHLKDSVHARWINRIPPPL